MAMKGFYRYYGKRAFDCTAALVGLILISPVLVFLALIVRWHLGKPVLFQQVRPGLRGYPFVLVKFRTMMDGYDKNSIVLPDSARLSSFGCFLRSTSLDELPELWNVLKGDMSLVGPRPLLMEYLPLYSREQQRRHEMCPGITGWAQVNGRNTISWEEKFKLDIWYVDNFSFWVDIKILWLSVSKVLKRSGINEEGSATTEKFLGCNSRGVQ